MCESSHVFNTRKGKATKPTATMKRGIALRKQLMLLPTIIVSDAVLGFPAAKPIVSVEDEIISPTSPVNDGYPMSEFSKHCSLQLINSNAEHATEDHTIPCASNGATKSLTNTDAPCDDTVGTSFVFDPITADAQPDQVSLVSEVVFVTSNQNVLAVTEIDDVSLPEDLAILRPEYTIMGTDDVNEMEVASCTSTVDTTAEKIQSELHQDKRLVAHATTIETAISTMAPSKLTQSPSKSRIPIAAKNTKLASMKATHKKTISSDSDSEAPSYMRPTKASKSRASETASIFNSGSRSSSQCFSVVGSPSPSPTDRQVTSTTPISCLKKTKVIKMSPFRLSSDVEATASSIAALHPTSSDNSTIDDTESPAAQDLSYSQSDVATSLVPQKPVIEANEKNDDLQNHAVIVQQAAKISIEAGLPSTEALSSTPHELEGALFEREPLATIDPNFSSDDSDSNESIMPQSTSSSFRGSSFPRLFQSSTAPNDLQFELENNFLGVTCFNELLEDLKTDINGNATKSDISKAFVLRVAKEHTYRRTNGISSASILTITESMVDRWENPHFQHQAKLGKISLSNFLGKLNFDDDEQTSGVEILGAFKAAALEEIKWHKLAS